MANIVEQIKIGGTSYNIASTAYAVCGSNADAPAKTADITGFVLISGVTVHIQFTNGNTATNPTLNINSTGAIPITMYGSTSVGSESIVPDWPSGAVVSFTYVTGTANYWVMNQGYNTNTTYTFSGGTNKFTVTPLGGSAQDVTITPSIANNITGSGTSDYLTKFNGTNTITNGPQLGSDTTKFLNNKGEWAVPAYIADTHYTANLITGASNNDTSNAAGGTNSIFLNLVENGTIRNSHNIVGSGSVTVASDANGKITITGNKSGTVTSITPGNGLINGTTGTSQAAIIGSGTISIKAAGVTDEMLAGSISNDKLSNKTISINGIAKELGQNFTLEEIGIASAMHFKGITTTELTDDDTTYTTVTIDDATYTPAAGDVVLYSDSEFVWTGSKWERLGRDSSFITSYISYGKISVAGLTGTDAVTANTTQLKATGGNEAFTFKTGNQWLIAAGTNGTAGNDILTVGHSLSGVTAGNYGDSSNQTPAYGGTFNVPYISVDAAGHITGISTHTVKIPAENNVDTKVTQNILGTSVSGTYPLLVSNYDTSVETTTATTANRVIAIHVQPSTGTLTATEFAGGGTGITALSGTVVKTALGTDSSTTATFLRKDGDWKTISVSVTANNSGSVVTGVGWNAGTQPSFTQGTLASASVTDAILTLVSQTADTFNKGTYPSLGTISKANLSIGMA